MRNKLYLKIGLIFGILVGISFLIIASLIKAQFNVFWNDSCARQGCSYTVQDLDINFFQGKLTGYNLQFVKEASRVDIPVIETKISYLALFKKKLLVENIDIYNPTINGFFSDSVFYRVVNDILTPSMEESSFEFFLKKLEIHSANAVQKISGSQLVIKEMGFVLNDKPEFAEMVTDIKNLVLKLENSEIDLGKAESSLSASKDEFRLNHFLVDGSLGKIIGNFRSTDKLQGTMESEIFLKTLFPDLDIELGSRGEFYGSLENPEVRLINYNISPIKLYDYNFDIAEHSVLFKSTASFNNFNISDLVIGDQEIDDLSITSDYKDLLGKLNLSFGEIEYAGVRFSNPQIMLDLTGKISSPNLHLNILSDIYLFGTAIPDAQVVGDLEQKIVKAQGAGFEFNYNFNKDELAYKLENLLLGNNTLNGKDIIKLDSNFKSKLLLNETPINFEKNGKIVKVSVDTPELKTKLQIDSEKLIINSEFIGLDSAKLINSPICTNLNGVLKYQANITDLKLGDGSLKVSNSSIGCGAQKLEILDNNLVITAGKIKLPKKLFNLEDQINLSGTFGLEDNDLRIKGIVDTKNLGFINPEFDNLEGKLNLEMLLSGDLFEPQFAGVINLQDFGASFNNVDISEGTGIITIEEYKFTFENLRAKMNQGTLAINGSYDLQNLKLGNIQFDFQDIIFEPAKNTIFQLSGNLKLANNNDNLALIGDIVIDNSRVARNINFRDMTRNFLKNLIQAPVINTELDKGSLPDLPINLFLTTNRGLIFSSNYLAAELSGSVNVTGTLNEPTMDGTLNIVNGWLGIQDRKLYVSSGEINFTPGSLEPKIDVFADTSLVTYLGNPVNISLSLTGSVSQPKLELDSDSDYTQAELLQLISTVGVPSNNYNFADSSNLGGLDLLTDSGIPFSSFLGKLTKIDSVSIEPALNPRTGLTEPAFLVEKKLSDQLSLLGQTFVSQNIADSRIFLDYPLSKRFTVSGIMDNDTTQEVLSLGFDLKYSVLGDDANLARVKLDGDTQLTELDIERAIGISKRTKYDEGSLKQYASSVRLMLQNLGYFNAEIDVKCDSECRVLRFNVNDVEPTVFNFESTYDKAVQKILDPYNNLNVTKENLNQLKINLIKYFRSEGWVNAKIYFEYIGYQTNLKVDLGKRYVLEFEGNEFFTIDDLFNRVNFYTRINAFGGNFAENFRQEFITYYNEFGFNEATVNIETEDKDTYKRIKFKISEGSQPDVESVDFESTEDVWEIISDNKKLTNDIRSLTIISDLELKNLTERIKQELIEAGYDSNEVSYLVDDNKIIFKVNLGSKVSADWIDIDDRLFPDIIKPRPPYSIFKANQYLDLVLDNLKDQGYLAPSYSSELVNDRLKITLEYGAVVTANKVTIQGIPEDLIKIIRSKIKFESGSIVSRKLLNQTKKTLVNSGLFSKVEIKPVDGKIDDISEDFIINIEPRSLNDLKVGAGVNSELGYHLFIEGRDHGLFKDGRALFLRANTYLKTDLSEVTEGTAGIRYSDPDFSSMFPRMNIDGRFQRLNQPSLAYDLDRKVVDSLFINGLGKFKLDWGLSLFQDIVDSYDPQLVNNFEQKFSLGQLGMGITYDARDNALNPQEGFQIGLDIKASNSNVIGDISMVQGVAKASVIQPISYSRFSVADNLRAGVIETPDDIPVSTRFFLGGRTSVRGFKENSLGNKTELGNAFGGDKLVSNNLELQYRLNQSLQTHIFLDSGYLSFESAPTKFRYSTGVGMSFISAVGPIGVDVGTPLNREPDDASWRVHFSLGSIF